MHVSRKSASAIADGAAWVAHDQARLHLAKNVELTLARNSYLPLLPAGLEMPLEREQRRERFSLYCVDPSDGFGKFSLVSPHRPGPRVLPDDKRRSLCNMMLKVDGKAQPFRERLELEVGIDENLVLKVQAWSLNQKGRAEDEVHDLEFALATPGASAGWVGTDLKDADEAAAAASEPCDLVVRSNLAVREDLSLVPGEVMYRINPYYFMRDRDPPQIQDDERLYYQPCSVCRRSSNDPLCRCATGMPTPAQPEVRPSV